MDITELLPYTQLISNIATIIAVIIVVFTFRTYIVNLKKLNFDVVARCVDIYRDKFINLTKDSSDEERIKRYLDLINEELFYYEQNYLPEIVALEWMDGIIDLIPIIQNDNIINKKSCIQLIHKNKLLYVNSRILKSFTVKKDMIMT